MTPSIRARFIRLAVATASLAACHGGGGSGARIAGQTSFVSAPPAGMTTAGRSSPLGGAAQGAAADTAGPRTAGAATTTTPRTVQETDLYRLEGDRLYYLNGYRGLMVFDVSDVDHPALIGRSPIYGSPVDMIVRNGVAIVVVADWYGAMDDGTPFHGSIVRGLDATDPAHIKVLGEAKLGGWVADDRVVGDVIYAVSEDYGWDYGWDAASTAQPQQSVIVSSVSFAGNAIRSVGKVAFPGFSGVFNVTPNAIMLAHDVAPAASDADAGMPGSSTTKDAAAAKPAAPSGQTELLYLDISDPAGQIVQRGSLRVAGHVQGWGADNGRWNLDFADGQTAHVVACATGLYGSCDGTSGYVLSIADFSNPDAPALASQLVIPSTGWSVAARFDTDRLYLSPQTYDYGTGATATPFLVYDLGDAKAPKLAGTLDITGTIWNILPAPNHRMFALGTQYMNTPTSSGSAVSLQYLDVTAPSAPQLIGTSSFGSGWAWTPAAGTFKAFTMDAAQGLVVLPFSGWSNTSQTYNNGLQLIDFTASSIATGGAAHTRGWVERGIFVKNRLVSLSDLSLAVVDYANHAAPVVTAELTLARNVITAQPQGANIAEISGDWWGNDQTWSEVRLLPIANVEELTDAGNAATVRVDGVNARVFTNGKLAYVVTDVQIPATCDTYGRPVGDGATLAAGTGRSCTARAQQVQVVDLSSGVALRGKYRLPADPWGWWGWGWWGCYPYDWFGGAEVVQVAGDALAFRRWEPIYDPATGYALDANSSLWVVDLSDPDAPSAGSVSITDDPNGWWGNMQIAGNTLYVGHYEWADRSTGDGGAQNWTVRYFADRVDLSDRAHPRIAAKINVPGLLVGGSSTDPDLLYTIDYRWDANLAKDDFDVVRVQGSQATLLSTTPLAGWVGTTFVRGSTAYVSAQEYTDPATGGSGGTVKLHAIDLSNPAAPVDRVSQSARGWGWLLDVEGDRAVVQSGWGGNGVDIYRLVPGQAPEFRQFTRTLGWWANGVSRQDDVLFLASGYWGVQKIDLQ
ncbi:MAG TPA: beta-propeller domain-containing protein [Polyangia bacterium]|nr:beta-propeller domain-containing protein [Polyangia bacterium]